MDLASQTQRHLTMRGFGSTHNGSQPPYHPSLGQEFSSTPNKFPSFGMVVAGDAQRVAAETGEKVEQVDSGLNYGELSGLLNMYFASSAWKVRVSGLDSLRALL